MKKLVLTAALSAACLSLAACGDREAENAADNTGATTEAEGSEATTGGDGNTAGGAGATVSAWKGARIVEENGVTYRIDPDGTRVRLTERDSRIVVENGTRYRVDPDGTRVRIDDRGLDIDIDGPNVDLPDVDVGINKKGNLDVDVTDDPDPKVPSDNPDVRR